METVHIQPRFTVAPFMECYGVGLRWRHSHHHHHHFEWQ